MRPMATSSEVSSFHLSRTGSAHVPFKARDGDATSNLRELEESGLRDVEDVPRRGGGIRILSRDRRQIDRHEMQGTPRSGQDGRAVDAAGTAGRRAACRRACAPEAIFAGVRNRRQGQQERQCSKQGDEAKGRTAHHRRVVYTKAWSSGLQSVCFGRCYARTRRTPRSTIRRLGRRRLSRPSWLTRAGAPEPDLPRAAQGGEPRGGAEQRIDGCSSREPPGMVVSCIRRTRCL